MRNFVTFMALVAFVFVNGAFAQPRDLFAEFEAEEASAAQAAEQASEQTPEQVPEQEKAQAAEQGNSDPAKVTEKETPSGVATESTLEQTSEQIPAQVAETPATETTKAVDLPTDSSAKIASEVPTEEPLEQAPENEAEQVAVQTSPDSIKTAEIDSTEKIIAVDSAAVDSAIVNEVAVDSATVDSSVANNATTDSAAVAQVVGDSITASSSSSVAVVPPSSSSMSRRDLLGPVKVSKVNGIDEMKGRYKSPRKAMFMSLVVPGSGQLYVGGSKFSYIRGGVYLALEAALWGSWYYFSVYKYNDQVKKYKKFAKEHYSIGQYEQGMRDLYDADAVNYESEFRTRYLGDRESFCEGIYGNAETRGCYDKDKLYTNDAGYKSDFVNNPVSLGEEMENIDFDNASTIYSLIADRSYVLGWDDVTDVAVATNLGLEDPNSSTVVLGTSSNLSKYRSLRGKANDYADMQAWFFGGLILNHIISAVDAALTANAFNKTLYQEDLSWYDHLHFDSGLQFINGFGVNVQASWGF